MEKREKKKKELHLTDITKLSYIAQEAVTVALEHDSRLTDYGEFVEKVDCTREDVAIELQNMRGADDPVFRVENGMWLGKSISDRIIEDFPEDICEYFRPKQHTICCLMQKTAGWHFLDFGEDITDEYLLSLFSYQWYAMLVQIDQLDDWNRTHHLPSPVPGRGEEWYVDLGDRVESGSLEYVVSEYCGEGLFYRYEDGLEESPHVHSFEGVLQEALEHPETFSIEEHEECYSEQERQFLKSFVEKLKADRKENFPHKV